MKKKSSCPFFIYISILFKFMTIVPCSLTIISHDYPDSIFSVTSSLILIGSYQVPPSQPLAYPHWPSASAPDHPHGPLLNLPQCTNVLPGLEARNGTQYIGNLFHSGNSFVFWPTYHSEELRFLSQLLYVRGLTITLGCRHRHAVCCFASCVEMWSSHGWGDGVMS